MLNWDCQKVTAWNTDFLCNLGHLVRLGQGIHRLELAGPARSIDRQVGIETNTGIRLTMRHSNLLNIFTARLLPWKIISYMRVAVVK